MKSVVISGFSFVGIASVVIFIIVIIGVRNMKSSEPYLVAEAYLKNNNEVQKQVGEVEDFDYFLRGTIEDDESLSYGYAFFTIGVQGKQDHCDVVVGVWKNEGQSWKIKEVSIQK